VCAGEEPAPLSLAERRTLALRSVRGDGRYSSSLAIGLEILACFTAERPVLGIADLAGELELGRSTSHRYAATLVMLGLLEQDHSRRYRLSPRSADLGLTVLASLKLREHARAYLSELRAQTGHTVSLAILDGLEVFYIARLPGSRRGQYEVDRGVGVTSRLLAHHTAIGRALIAHLHEADREALLEKLELNGGGAGAFASRRALRRELERVRNDGLAVGEQERSRAVRSLAAPVVDAQGTAVAAIDVAVPSASCSREAMVELFGPPLRAAGECIAGV
jgi:IclR family transcriptional regulator, pca regulon regulatory protein